jgi:hypothetical protein
VSTANTNVVGLAAMSSSGTCVYGRVTREGVTGWMEAKAFPCTGELAAWMAVAPTVGSTEGVLDVAHLAPNNHRYKVFSPLAGDYAAIRALVQTAPYSNAGVAGHVATVSSYGENQMVWALAASSGVVWISGNDAGIEGSWYLDTGPESGDQFWAGAAGGSAVGGRFTN